MTCSRQCSLKKGCCLDTLCEMWVSNDFESAGEILFSHLGPESCDPASNIKVESPGTLSVSESATQLPILSYDDRNIPQTPWALFFSEQFCWEHVRPFVQMITDLQANCGYVHSELVVGRDKVSYIWHMYSKRKKGSHSFCADKVWFEIPAKFYQRLEWLLSHKLRLCLGNTFCLEMSVQGCTVENLQQSIRVLNMVHHNSNDLAFLCDLRSDMVWSSEALKKYVAEITYEDGAGLNSSWIIGNHDKEKDVHLKTRLIVNDVAPHAEPEDMIFHCEVEEMELVDIKCEEVSETEDSRAVDNFDLKVFTGFLHENFSTLNSFLEKYSAMAQAEGFFRCGQEPMLLVQCPGCLAEYKFNSDRLSRLLHHVMRDHSHDSTNLVAVIRKKYQPLLHCMQRRMEQRGLWPDK